MNSKIIGRLDIVFGSFGLLFPVVGLLIYPKLGLLYQEFGNELPFFTRAFPYLTVFITVILIGVIYVGAKLAFTKSPGKKMYKLGLFGLIATLILAILYVPLMLTSLIFPIYSLTSGF